MVTDCAHKTKETRTQRSLTMTRWSSFPASLVFATALVSFIAIAVSFSSASAEGIPVVASSTTTRKLLQEGGEGGEDGAGGGGGDARQLATPAELPAVSDTADVVGGFPGGDQDISAPGRV